MLFFGKKRNEKKEYIESLVKEIQWMDIIAVNRTRFWNPLTWSSKLTRILTASKYSHVLVGGPKGIGFSTGATGFPDYRFGTVKLEDYLMAQDSFIVQRIWLSEEQIAKGQEAVYGEIGMPYPEADLISMIAQNFVKPGEPDLILNTKGRVCSAITAYFFEAMGRKLAPHLKIEAGMMTPQRCLEDAGALEIGIWPRRKENEGG